MKIYVVTQGEYSAYHIVGVTLDRQKAERWVEHMYFGGRKVKGAKHWRQPFEYFTSNYEVIAWMPLPEPYKGD